MSYKLSKISRKSIFRGWSLSLFIVILLWLYPISYGVIRLAIILFSLAIYLGFIYLTWHHQFIRSVAIALLLISSAFMTLPGRAIDTDLLRQNYITQLNQYENTHYLWGGENKIGIDCSGLVRKGLIQASFQQGIVTLNPDLLRTSFALWWYDSSAEALRDEYRNYTKKLFLSQSINRISDRQIKPGDLAVTEDGFHILAYLGHQVWIEADPIYKKVIKVSIPEVSNPWFNTPVYVLRWQRLIQT